MKLVDLATQLGCQLIGDGSVEIEGVAGIESANAKEITFLTNPKYAAKVSESQAGAIIVGKELEAPCPPQLISSNPYLDFARSLELFYSAPETASGMHPTATVAASARVANSASIGAYSVIGEDVVIGEKAVIHPHVVIYAGVKIGDDFVAHSHAVVREYCQIGNRVILQNGVQVGTDGYGFARTAEGKHHKIPQSGIVVIEDDVEIQAGSCIDRAAVGETRIRRGAKIDNLVQIGHAVEIGEDNLICSQVGIAGSTTLGKDCILAGQVGVINHLTIGDGVIVTAQTGVGHNIESGRKISGSPEIDNGRWLRCTAVYNRLPELDKAVRRIQKKLDS